MRIQNEVRRCHYQSAKKKCSDITKDVAKNYSAAEIDCWKDETISELIYRDNLIDWQFLKNFAERHGQILFIDSKTDKLKMNAGARSCYFFETTLEIPELNIGGGSAVKYENKTQAVIASRIFIRENFLFNEITLRPAEGCRTDAWDVMNHFDEFYYLSGKILSSKDNNVKVQFDCDEQKNADEALNIPFESNASNYLYTMPDDGEKVCVYVDRIRQAAMCSLRVKNVEDKPENRSFKIKNAGAKAQPVELSDLAKELDKITGRKDKGPNQTTPAAVRAAI